MTTATAYEQYQELVHKVIVGSHSVDWEWVGEDEERLAHLIAAMCRHAETAGGVPVCSLFGGPLGEGWRAGAISDKLMEDLASGKHEEEYGDVNPVVQALFAGQQ